MGGDIGAESLDESDRVEVGNVRELDASDEESELLGGCAGRADEDVVEAKYGSLSVVVEAVKETEDVDLGSEDEILSALLEPAGWVEVVG